MFHLCVFSFSMPGLVLCGPGRAGSFFQARKKDGKRRCRPRDWLPWAMTLASLDVFWVGTEAKPGLVA